MKVAKTIAICAALVVTSTPAYSASADFLNIIQNLAGQYVRSWDDLDARRADISSQIDAAVKSGQLTTTQATDFRNDLNKIAQEETAAKASGKRMSLMQSVGFSNELSSLANALQQAATQTASTLPDVDALQTQLNGQIDTAVNSGQLNATNAAALKAELQQVANIEAAYKSETGGNLTARQIELLSDQLNKAKADIDQQIKVSQAAVPALDEKRANIDAKITAALAAAQINAADAAAMRQQLAVIATEQTNYRNAGGGLLTGSQVLKLASELEAVDDKINAKMATAVVPPTTTTPPVTVSTIDLDSLKDLTASRLSQLLNAGRIAPQFGAQVGRELDQITALEAAYKNTVTGITAAQVGQLRSQLTELNTRLDANIGLNQSGTTTATTPPPSTTPGGGFRVGNFPVINNRAFSDVRGYWGEPYVSELSSRGVIGGFPNGSFGPNDDITRAQFAAIVSRALGLQPVTGASNFRDVAANYWAAGVIGAASNAGLITGFPDGSFRPEDKITRAQALVILSKALGSAANAGNTSAALNAYADANAVPTWAAPSLAQAASAHIIVNFPDAGQIRPTANATRGEVAALMYQTLNALGANLPQLRIGVMGAGM